MVFDPNNEIVKLCAEGMDMEGQGKFEEARRIFMEAWEKATNDFDRFTAAHYIARHQKTVADKLNWDETALKLALKINDEAIKSTFPSLYLNIGKCYEDLSDTDNATKNYQLAFSFTDFLPDNEYGNMIKGGIKKGLERTIK